ncbi:MAG: hypothetical protein IIB62_08100 [Proteobacteria bacterium]|nr:hypothetical protein [Pseudomonadota bacterium]
MKKPVRVLVCSFCCLMFGVTTLMAAPYLEMSTSCEGRQSNSTNRIKIIGWNGQSRQAYSERVYDFRVECNGSSQHIMDLFLSAASSDRYKKKGGTLYKHTRDQSKSVKVRDRECRTVYEDDWCARTPDELYKICRGNGLCEIEFSAYRCKRPRERCRSAKYETRYVPVWEPFPTGYAPLPSGARIVEVSEQRPQVATVPQPKAATTPQLPTKTPSNGGPGVGTLLLIIAAGAAVFLFVRRQRPAVSGEQHSPGGGNQHRDESSYFEDQTQAPQSDEAEKEMPSDELPQSRAQAYALLNIDEETTPEVANRIYRAMAQAWHVDLATDEADRELREKKMKQLNAAKEYILGKRT